MATGDVNYKDLAQLKLNNAMQTVATVTASTSAVLLKIIVCNMSDVARGYDLAVRPTAETLEGKHYWRSGNITGKGKLPAGATEAWDLNVPLQASVIIAAACEIANSVVITVARVEKEN
jgi:hypothetical protein